MQDGSPSGTDINQASLTGVRASNVYGVALNGNCTPAGAVPVRRVGFAGGFRMRDDFSLQRDRLRGDCDVGIRTSLLIVGRRPDRGNVERSEEPERTEDLPYRERRQESRASGRDVGVLRDLLLPE